MKQKFYKYQVCEQAITLASLTSFYFLKNQKCDKLAKFELSTEDVLKESEYEVSTSKVGVKSRAKKSKAKAGREKEIVAAVETAKTLFGLTPVAQHQMTAYM